MVKKKPIPAPLSIPESNRTLFTRTLRDRSAKKPISYFKDDTIIDLDDDSDDEYEGFKVSKKRRRPSRPSTPRKINFQKMSKIEVALLWKKVPQSTTKNYQNKDSKDHGVINYSKNIPGE